MCRSISYTLNWVQKTKTWSVKPKYVKKCKRTLLISSFIWTHFRVDKYIFVIHQIQVFEMRLVIHQIQVIEMRRINLCGHLLRLQLLRLNLRNFQLNLKLNLAGHMKFLVKPNVKPNTLPLGHSWWFIKVILKFKENTRRGWIGAAQWIHGAIWIPSLSLKLFKMQFTILFFYKRWCPCRYCFLVGENILNPA